MPLTKPVQPFPQNQFEFDCRLDAHFSFFFFFFFKVTRHSPLPAVFTVVTLISHPVTPSRTRFLLHITLSSPPLTNLTIITPYHHRNIYYIEMLAEIFARWHSLTAITAERVTRIVQCHSHLWSEIFPLKIWTALSAFRN